MTFYGRINRNSLVTQAFTVQRVTVDITNNLSALSVVLSYSSRQDYLLDSFLRSIGGGESWDWNYRRRRRMLQRNHVDHRDPLEKKIAKNCVFFLLRGDKTLRSSSVTVLFFVRRQQTVSCSLPRFDQRCLSESHFFVQLRSG